MCGVGGDERLAQAPGVLDRRLEERQRGLRIAARAQDPPSLEVDANEGTRARARQRFGVPDELLGLVEVAAQPVDPGELRQHLRAPAVVLLGVEELTKAAFARVEIVEVPQRPEVVAHDDLLRGTNA